MTKYLISLLVILSFLIGRLKGVAREKREGLIIIPGLSHESRISVVVANLEVLSSKMKDWDCVIYMTAPRQDFSFWKTDVEGIRHLSSVCETVDYPNRQIGDAIYAAQSSLIQHSYDYVFLLSENCRLDERENSNSQHATKPFDLNRIISVMKYNNLTVASPLVRNSNSIRTQSFRNIMQTPALPGTEGHLTTFLAIHAWIMTMDAYKALWEIAYPDINPHGWGYDLWYHSYALDRLSNHRMGVVATIGSESLPSPPPKNPLTEAELTVDAKAKWSAQLSQENFYSTYYDVPLKSYRQIRRTETSSFGTLLPHPF